MVVLSHNRLCITLALFLFCVFASRSSSSPPYLPNYYWVGSGFDSRNASITQVSLGIKQPIVQYSGKNTTADGKWTVPNGLYPYSYPACVESPVTSNTISGAFAYSNEISTSVSTSVGIGKLFSGSSSVDMTNTKKEGLEFSVYMYDSWVICETYQLALNSYTTYNLTSEFVKGVSSIPTSFNPKTSSSSDMQALQTFFSNYGDSFITYAIEGGLLAQRATISGYTKASMESHSDDVSQQAQISFEAEIGESTSTNTSSSAYQQFSQNATYSNVLVLGGDTADSSNYSEWIPTIASNPVPVKFALQPVYEWMNENYFPDDSDIAMRAKAYSNYTQWLFETGAEFVVLDPFYNIALSTGGKFQQSASVTCPTGAIMLSGGCSTNDLSSTDWPWRISQTYPILNSGSSDSWNCLNGEDDGTFTYYYDSIAYIICMQSQFSVDVGNGVEQSISVVTEMKKASSDSNQKFNNSVTTPSCDAGYYLVGGGCSVSDYSNDHPWIIRASAPANSNTAWFCFAGEDYNTDNHDVSVTAYAMCAKWTSTLTYIPNLPLGYQVVTCTSSDGSQYQNHCNAICPTGYLVVGGGCTVSDLYTSNWPWRLSQSQPLNNGWICQSGEDNGSREYYETVTAYAICVMF